MPFYLGGRLSRLGLCRQFSLEEIRERLLPCLAGGKVYVTQTENIYPTATILPRAARNTSDLEEAWGRCLLVSDLGVWMAQLQKA